MAASRVASETNVCNLALTRIGRKTVTNIESGTDEASELCELVYADVRNEVSKIFPWSCLVARTTISSPTTATNSDFSFYVTLGSSVLSVLDIDGDPSVPFRVESSKLYTNVESGYYRSVNINATVTQWDPLLLAAIVARLSTVLAYRLSREDLQLVGFLYQEYMTILSVAVRLKIVEKTEEAEKVLASMQQFNPVALMKQNYVVEE